MRYQIDLIWISSIWATGSQKKWRHTDSVFDFVVETLDSLLSVWSVWSYIIRIKFVFCKSSQYCPKHLFSFMTWLGSLHFCSIETVSWQYLLTVSSLSDDGMWLAVQRLRTVVRGLTWPGRIIPSHHLLLEVLDFSLGVSKSQMYAKLSMI